jgi:hypothetical protein
LIASTWLQWTRFHIEPRSTIQTNNCRDESASETVLCSFLPQRGHLQLASCFRAESFASMFASLLSRLRRARDPQCYPTFLSSSRAVCENVQVAFFCKSNPRLPATLTYSHIRSHRRSIQETGKRADRSRGESRTYVRHALHGVGALLCNFYRGGQMFPRSSTRSNIFSNCNQRDSREYMEADQHAIGKITNPINYHTGSKRETLPSLTHSRLPELLYA